VIVIDPDTPWVLDPADLKSACKNTPPVNCATLKTSDNASIPAFYQVSVFRSCLPVGRS